MLKFKNNLFCINCGKTNHKYSGCNDPITSYGLICYYNNNNIILIRRKYTLSFIDFLMGKYNIDDITYITILFSRMTRYEIELILKYMDFKKLRDIVELNGNTKYFRTEYENSNIKFTYIYNMRIIENVIYIIDKIFNEEFKKIILNSKNYNNILNNKIFDINICNNTLTNIKKIVTHNKIYEEPEWEIPKGKRKGRENNLATALREFIEETNLQNIEIFKNVIPLDEEIKALNNNKYKFVYYLSKIKDKPDNINFEDDENIILNIDENNKELTREIGGIGLININNIEKYLRYYQIEKKKVIYKSYQIFNNYDNYFY